MHDLAYTSVHPEGMSDVPGICELPLTRAVVQYRNSNEVGGGEDRIQDIGLALVLEGRYASTAEVIDLGSGDVKLLDLSRELVLLDWAYEPTVRHINDLISQVQAEEKTRETLRTYCFRTALQVLERTGYGPITRATFLRIGFRDICQDLDLHEGASVRMVLAGGGLARAYLDADLNALAFRTMEVGPREELEESLEEAFPSADLIRFTENASRRGFQGTIYQVRFPLAGDLMEARRTLRSMRFGLLHLLAKFEPVRFRNTEDGLRTFGVRDSLQGIGAGPLPEDGRAVTIRSRASTQSAYLH